MRLTATKCRLCGRGHHVGFVENDQLEARPVTRDSGLREYVVCLGGKDRTKDADELTCRRLLASSCSQSF